MMIWTKLEAGLLIRTELPGGTVTETDYVKGCGQAFEPKTYFGRFRWQSAHHLLGAYRRGRNIIAKGRKSCFGNRIDILRTNDRSSLMELLTWLSEWMNDLTESPFKPAYPEVKTATCLGYNIWWATRTLSQIFIWRRSFRLARCSV